MSTSLNKDQSGKTAVGNYFVSNYPPYSFWKPEYANEAVAALNSPPETGTPLGMYLHIPFCRKRCHFCYFKVYTGVKSAQIRAYVDALLKELLLYKKKTFVGKRKPTFIYFGGGTPSFLSTHQLNDLMCAMKGLFPWDEAEEVTFECEPGTLSEKKVKFLKDSGVTRLSLGVENLDDNLLKVNGRSHTTKEIYNAYGWAQNADFPQINIDLIAGMLEETEANWQKNIDRVIDMNPDSITIYQMEVPYNTTIYKNMQQAGNDYAPIASWETKRQWVDDAFNRLEKVGYTINSAYTAVKDVAATRFVYRDQLWKGADLMSLGVASFSHVNGTHYQNEKNLKEYLKRLEKGELPVYRALTPTKEELCLREFILQLKLGHVRFEYFRKKFDQNITELFAQPIQELQKQNLLDITGRNLSLTREGLMQVDRLIREFFFPSDRIV